LDNIYFVVQLSFFLKEWLSNYVEKNPVSEDKYKQSIYHWNRYTL